MELIDGNALPAQAGGGRGGTQRKTIIAVHV